MAHVGEHKLREYLLGQLGEGEEEQIELRLLTDPDFAEEHDIVVNEITDDYIAGRFEGPELDQVEDHFFKSADRRNKLQFALALKKRKSDLSKDDKGLIKRWFNPYLAIAASLLFVVGGFYIWRLATNNARLNDGLTALQSAFRDERPLEARLSGFAYAPFPDLRGSPATQKIDQNELGRAELTLLDALKKNPTPAVHHGLGKVFLAKKEFDRAINEFDEALKNDPKNPQLYSDLGAAWLEKAKIDLEKAKANPQDSSGGKGMEELGRSLERLNQALKVNPNLLEALFNRALCRQWLNYDQQAQDDWREYLKRDSSSRWAEEARQKLKLLETTDKKISQRKDQLLNDFLAAYSASNDEAAWAAITRSRERRGNFIVEALLDEYLSLAASGRKQEASDKLRALTYESLIEERKAADRFTSDLVNFYKNATPAQRALSMKARETAKSASERYYKVEFEEALALYSRARKLFASAKNSCETLFAESWIGYCLLRIPRVPESMQAFEGLNKIYAQKGYRSLAAQSLNALSDAQLSGNEFSKALDSANHALKLSQDIEDTTNIIRSLGQIVSVQLNLGSYRESLNSTYRAIDIAENSTYDPTLIWLFYHEAALDYFYEGLPSAALDSEKEAERLANVSSNPLLKARSLDRLALLYEQAHEYQTAIALLNQAFSEAEKISGTASKAVTQVHTALSLGQLYREIGNLPQAVEYYDRTLELSKHLNNLEFYLYQAHKGKLLALIASHEYAAAEKELGTVVSLFEGYRDKIVEESYRNKFFDVGQNTYDLVVDFEYTRTNFERAFELAEASRARSLFDLMTNGSRIVDKANRLGSLMIGTRPLRGSEIQNSMSDRVQILEYAVLQDKLLMWVMTKKGLKHAEAQITASELEGKIHRYRNAVVRNRGSGGEELAVIARDLYANLISPVEDRGYLDAGLQLCIVPDKSLNFLPFAALVSPSSGKYLIEKYTLELTPSATVFVTSSENADHRQRHVAERLLSVGNPRFDHATFDLPDLPMATYEAVEIAKYYAPASPLIEENATSGRVMQALARADVVHFATHFISNDDSPLLSKLLLANERSAPAIGHLSSNGFIQASDIYKLQLSRTRLVVLSACQSGIEQAYNGEGAIGMARPFIAAGVPVVVVSLWPVDSTATAQLMISLHRHRKQDQDHPSTVEALRRAQLEMLRDSQPGFQEPYAWAAFQALGGYANF